MQYTLYYIYALYTNVYMYTYMCVKWYIYIQLWYTIYIYIYVDILCVYVRVYDCARVCVCEYMMMIDRIGKKLIYVNKLIY